MAVHDGCRMRVSWEAMAPQSAVALAAPPPPAAASSSGHDKTTALQPYVLASCHTRIVLRLSADSLAAAPLGSEAMKPPFRGIA